MNKSYELVEGLNNSDILNLYNDILEGDKLAECVCYRSGFSSEHPSECWGGNNWSNMCVSDYTITNLASCRSECTKRCGAGSYFDATEQLTNHLLWIGSATNGKNIEWSCWYNR